MKPTLKWIKKNIQVTGLTIAIDDNLIGSQFVTMTHESSEVISEINDCLLSNLPAYYDHISYGSCDDADMDVDGYFLKITVWEDTGEAESYRSKRECHSCGFVFETDEVELVELKSVFLSWKECPKGSDYFCVDCLPTKKTKVIKLSGEMVEVPLEDHQIYDTCRHGVSTDIDCSDCQPKKVTITPDSKCSVGLQSFLGGLEDELNK